MNESVNKPTIYGAIYTHYKEPAFRPGERDEFDVTILDPDNNTTVSEKKTYYRMCTMGDVVERFIPVAPVVYEEYKDGYVIPTDIGTRCVTMGDVRNSDKVMSVTMLPSGSSNVEVRNNFNVFDYYNEEEYKDSRHLYVDRQYIYDEASNTVISSVTGYIYKNINNYRFNGKLGNFLPLKKRKVIVNEVGDWMDYDDYLVNYSSNSNLCRLADIECIYNTYTITVELRNISLTEPTAALYTFSNIDDSIMEDDLRYFRCEFMSHTSYSPYIYVYKVLSGHSFKFRLNKDNISEDELIKYNHELTTYTVNKSVPGKFKFDKDYDINNIEGDVKIVITPVMKERCIVNVRVVSTVSDGIVTVDDIYDGNKPVSILADGSVMKLYYTSYEHPKNVNFSIKFNSEDLDGRVPYRSCKVYWKVYDGSPVADTAEPVEIFDPNKAYGEFTFEPKDADGNPIELNPKFSYTLMLDMEPTQPTFDIPIYVYPSAKINIKGGDDTVGITYKYRLQNSIENDPPVWWEDCFVPYSRYVTRSLATTYGATMYFAPSLAPIIQKPITVVPEWTSTRFENVATNGFIVAGDSNESVDDESVDILVPHKDTASETYYQGVFRMIDEYNSKMTIQFITEPYVEPVGSKIQNGWYWYYVRNKVVMYGSDSEKERTYSFNDVCVIDNVLKKGDSLYLVYRYTMLPSIEITVDSTDICLTGLRYGQNNENVVLFDYGDSGTKTIVLKKDTNEIDFEIRLGTTQDNDLVTYKFDIINPLGNDIISTETETWPMDRTSGRVQTLHFENLEDNRTRKYKLYLKSHKNYIEKDIVVMSKVGDMSVYGYCMNSGDEYSGVFESPSVTRTEDGDYYKWTFHMIKGTVIPLIVYFDSSNKNYSNGLMTADEYFQGLGYSIRNNSMLNGGVVEVPVAPVTPFGASISTGGSSPGGSDEPVTPRRNRIRNRIMGVVARPGTTIPPHQGIYDIAGVYNVSGSAEKTDNGGYLIIKDFSGSNVAVNASTLYIVLTPSAISAYSYTLNSVFDNPLCSLYRYPVYGSNIGYEVYPTSGDSYEGNTDDANPNYVRFQMRSANIHIINSLSYSVLNSRLANVASGSNVAFVNGVGGVEYSDIDSDGFVFNITPDIQTRKMFLRLTGDYDMSVTVTNGDVISKSKSDSVLWYLEDTNTGELVYNVAKTVTYTSKCILSVYCSSTTLTTIDAAKSANWVKVVDDIEYNCETDIQYKYGFSLDGNIDVLSGYGSIMIDVSVPVSPNRLEWVSSSVGTLYETVGTEANPTELTYTVVPKNGDGLDILWTAPLPQSYISFNDDIDVYNGDNKLGVLDGSFVEYFKPPKWSGETTKKFTYTLTKDIIGNLKYKDAAGALKNVADGHKLRNAVTIKHPDCNNVLIGDILIKERVYVKVISGTTGVNVAEYENSVANTDMYINVCLYKKIGDNEVIYDSNVNLEIEYDTDSWNKYVNVITERYITSTTTHRITIKLKEALNWRDPAKLLLFTIKYGSEKCVHTIERYEERYLNMYIANQPMPNTSSSWNAVLSIESSMYFDTDRSILPSIAQWTQSSLDGSRYGISCKFYRKYNPTTKEVKTSEDNYIQTKVDDYTARACTFDDCQGGYIYLLRHGGMADTINGMYNYVGISPGYDGIVYNPHERKFPGSFGGLDWYKEY